MIYILSAIAAYSIWGLSPIFWKQLDHLNTFELASYRVLISFICFLPFFNFTRYRSLISKIKKAPFISLMSCSLMFVNIYLFVYAVNAGMILQASFGYYLSPLLSMALAVFVLKEKLSRIKLFAIFLAFTSIMIRFSDFAEVPWVAFILGSCFALYGVLRKFSHLNAVEITFSEMSSISIPSAIILFYLINTGQAITPELSSKDVVLLAFIWIPTLVPFALFSHAAKNIELNILSFILYLSPTIQFLLGAYVYNEKITHSQWISFILIWCACLMLIVTKIKGLKFARK